MNTMSDTALAAKLLNWVCGQLPCTQKCCMSARKVVCDCSVKSSEQPIFMPRVRWLWVSSQKRPFVDWVSIRNTEGIVDALLNTAGVKVAVLVKESGDNACE